MEKICLDFKAALDFLRGDPATIEKLMYYADREELCITSMTLMHLYETVSRQDVVGAFAANMTVLPFDKKAAQMATKVMNELREHGESVQITDSLLTAGVCMANDALLYAGTPGNYVRIRGLKKV
ncbi:MAG: type II toxin-antitoxin system VapC family toxin [Candidatus Micrarchaeota archaeon]